MASDARACKERWLDTPSEEWTAELAKELLAGLSDDDSELDWIIQAGLATRCLNAEAQLAILDGAVAASERAAESDPACKLCRERAESASSDDFEVPDSSRQLIQYSRELLQLHDKTSTYALLYPVQPSAIAKGKQREVTEPVDGPEDEDVDASWAFDEDDEADTEHNAQSSGEPSEPMEDLAAGPAPNLPDFLDKPLLQLALEAASQGSFRALKVLFEKHAKELAPHRLAILDSLPLFVDFTDTLDILPLSSAAPSSAAQWIGKPWRASQDWVETDVMAAALRETPPASISTDEEIAGWYKTRVSAIDATTGRMDNALVLVQYGAAQGIAGLDALGEELSLLSKFIYDRPLPSNAIEMVDVDWTLDRWRHSAPSDIVAAYLAYSHPSSIADDIRKLVLPYLYVLESKLEREGRPNPNLHDTVLFQYLLNISPTRLDLLAAVFQASRSSAPGQRLIKSDEKLAKLALAAVYGFSGLSSWDVMGNIFDCLPSFEDEEEDASESASSVSSQSLFAIFSSQAGTSNRPAKLTASQIYPSLDTFSRYSLSKALDAFDLNLEAAEIFSRWSSPVPLSFFLTLSHDTKLQRSWAERLARTSAAAVADAKPLAAGRGGERLGKDFEFEDEWISLLDDLCRLAGPEEVDSKDTGVESDLREPKHAFSSLSKLEITKIFFSGLLSSGKFDLAKSLFNPSSGERPLESSVEQELVLAASREFFDNAETGNLHQGNMKLAFECLAVAPTTVEIRRERDFIEATSRLTSFRLLNSAGQPLTPIEIRLSDQLSLISQLLSANEDAYRHPEMILDIAAKLGYRGDTLAEARVLSMLADAALNAHDAKRAADICGRMIKVVEDIRKGRDKEKASKAAELAWKTCYAFGRTDEIKDQFKKKELLGQALLLCPPSEISEILAVWQAQDVTAGQTLLLSSPRKKHKPMSAPSHFLAGRDGLGIPFSMPSRSTTPSAAALTHSAESAARAALSVGRAASAYLPFRSGTPDSTHRSESPSRSRYQGQDALSPQGAVSGNARSYDSRSPGRSADAVRDEISNKSRALVSWLIGADEHEARR